MKSSKFFISELQIDLKASDFEVVKSSLADLLVDINLAQEKIPVDENVVKYDFKVSGSERTSLRTSSGT
jgi:hypothetical protein